MAIWNRSKSREAVPESNPPVPRRARVDTAPSKSPETETVFLLGESIRLKGELSATTDVEIRGEVEGTVRLDGYRLVVADTGQVMAEISARTILVTSQVVGNVTASEQIVIGSGGYVLGDLCAPSIRLEDGSQFTGGINKQAAPAKVTGHLTSDGGENSPRSEIEKSVAQARREGLYDQCRTPEAEESESDG